MSCCVWPAPENQRAELVRAALLAEIDRRIEEHKRQRRELRQQLAALIQQDKTEKLFEVDVTEYLMGERDKEQDPWLRDDLRIAVRTCVNASNGIEQPDVIATYEVLGIHPKLLWQAIAERSRAKLRGLYADFFDEQGHWRSEGTLADPAAIEQLIVERNKQLGQLPPKKPAHSIRKEHPCVHRKSI